MSNITRIDANARSVSDLLEKKKYSIDYYQREYRWESEHMEELISDLTTRFLGEYLETDQREDGAGYAHYFLGPIILSNKDGQLYIVDGQQRLTSLTLLLIYLNNLQHRNGSTELVDLKDYIFSDHRGKKSFNLQVPDREQVMEALYNGLPFDPTNQSESVQNIVARYAELDEFLPEEVEGNALPFFIDWLLFNVDLVEIVAFSDQEAYTIFETMNDRGLQLNMAAMLKSYLLSHIKDEADTIKANDLWKERILELIEMGRQLDVKEPEIEACKIWLRAKYATSIRERKKDSEDQDFELIGSTFHRWVRQNEERLGLQSRTDYREFVELNFEKFTRYYLQMRQLSSRFDPDFEHLYYNAYNNFTLQYMLAIAPVQLTDDADAAWRKVRAVTGFIDIFVARRMVNFRTLSYSSIVYTMFNLMNNIRDLELTDLVQRLHQELEIMPETFDAVSNFYLHGQNKRQVQYLLARITHFIERGSGIDTNFTRYINRSSEPKAKRFEVEHIWADKWGRHEQEFSTEEQFRQYRNSFGGLLLLPRGTNQSYNAATYEEKLPYYFSQNLLAQSLSPKCYEKNPNFLNFVRECSLGFRAHEQFSKSDLDERQALYRDLCEIIWDPNQLYVQLNQ